MWVCNKKDQITESLLPNTDNVFVYFLFLESAVDKSEVKYNPHSRSNYFSANVSVLVTVFRFCKKLTISVKV